MDQKITDLDIAISMSASDLIPIVDSNGDNKVLHGSQVKDYVADAVVSDIDDVMAMISDAYDNTATYAVGDYCIYNNTLYRCTTDISTPEDFNPAHWTITSIADEINKLKSDFDNSTSYGFTEVTIGDFYGSPLYRKGFVLPNITVPQNGNYTITVSDLISGNIRIINYKAIARAGTQYLLLPYIYSATSLAKFSMDIAIDNTSIVITRGDSNDLLINDLTIILEYIKVV